MNITGHHLLLTVSAMTLMACGGGGGNSPTSPTPPSPPGGGSTNTVPVASATASNNSPFEGEKVTLDGSESSDADGDNLTYQWSQISGPALEFDTPTSVSTELSIPNLTVDGSARIQLRVSDGTVTSTADVTLNLQNIVLSPVIADAIIEEKSLSYSNRVLSIPTRIPGFESENYLVYETVEKVFIDRFGYDDSDNPAIVKNQALETQTTSVTFEGSPGVFVRNYLAEFRDDEVVFFEPFGDPQEVLSVPVEQPCSLASNENFNLGNTFIGSRGGTSILVEFGGVVGDDPTLSTQLATFGTGSALCEMQIVQSPLVEGSAGFSDGRQRLLAFDQNADAIIEYAINRNDENRIIGIEEMATVPVDLDAPEGSNIAFVASKKIDSTGTKGLALVYSDGETEGTHRLVIVGSNADGSILQETYQWEYGTPTSIVAGNVDNHQGDSLFITTADSPYGVIFKSGGFFAGGTAYLPLIGPNYFDIGIGHDVVQKTRLGSQSRRGIMATFPDQNLIKVFER